MKFHSQSLGRFLIRQEKLKISNEEDKEHKQVDLKIDPGIL